VENLAESQFNRIANHDESVAVQGLDDLFQWASETVAEGLDSRSRKAKDQQVRRQVLNIIHRSADLQAKAKHADELAYLQRRVIALQAVVSERTDEVSNLKQAIMVQYFGMQRIPQLEERIIQLETERLQKQKDDEDCKHLINALAKVKKERDYLEELVTTNESENARLANLLKEAREEVTVLKNRRWWHLLFPQKQ